MQKIHQSIVIHAPKDKVWDTMLGEETYRQWTESFSPGSYFQGDWSQGSQIRFVTDNEQGGVDGMLSEIAENRRHEFISIKHIGMIQNGVEDTQSEMVKAWTPSFENYTFKEVQGGTEVTVDMDSEESMAPMMESMWIEALKALKELTETGKLSKVTVSIWTSAPMDLVWKAWTEPEHIMKWNFASPDWECPEAENDLRPEGHFRSRMAAKDGSAAFDFEGSYIRVDKMERIDYQMSDGRQVSVRFMDAEHGRQVKEIFDPETMNPVEMQKAGWQAILKNFKKYVEGLES